MSTRREWRRRGERAIAASEFGSFVNPWPTDPRTRPPLELIPSLSRSLGTSTCPIDSSCDRQPRLVSGLTVARGRSGAAPSINRSARCVHHTKGVIPLLADGRIRGVAIVRCRSSRTPPTSPTRSSAVAGHEGECDRATAWFWCQREAGGGGYRRYGSGAARWRAAWRLVVYGSSGALV